MRLSNDETAAVLRWLLGEDTPLPPSFPWRAQTRVVSRARTMWDLLGEQEIERLSKCLRQASDAFTDEWLVVTMNNCNVPEDVDDSLAVRSVAQAINSCMETLMQEDHNIYAPKVFVAKAITTAIDEAAAASRIRKGVR